jgi:hypothetical protein
MRHPEFSLSPSQQTYNATEGPQSADLIGTEESEGTTPLASLTLDGRSPKRRRIDEEDGS